MKITALARKITRIEGKKREVNIAQISERCINTISKGMFYNWVHYNL